MEKDYSKETRKIVQIISNKLLLTLKERSYDVDSDLLYSMIIDTLNLSEKIYLQRGNSYIDQISYVMTMSVITTIRNQMYIDYYKKLSLLLKTGEIDIKQKRDLEILKYYSDPLERCDLSRTMFSSISKNMVKTIIDYKDQSVFEKILQVKALSKEDIDILSNNSPFFEQERKKYDVDVNSSFIKDRIIRLNNSKYKNNNEQTYEEITDFIFKLFKVKSEDIIDFVDEICLEYKDLILDFENDFDIVNSKYGNISKKNLNKILKDMTKESTKVYKK